MCLHMRVRVYMCVYIYVCVCMRKYMQHTATHCNCNTLQHTAKHATHCNTLQHTATHFDSTYAQVHMRVCDVMETEGESAQDTGTFVSHAGATNFCVAPCSWKPQRNALQDTTCVLDLHMTLDEPRTFVSDAYVIYDSQHIVRG